jgi:uncharacterized protein (DUF2236 family)
MTTRYQPADLGSAGGPAQESQAASDEYGARYAAATDLVERSAAAYAAAVPTAPADDGYFGPASLSWRISGDLTGPLAGLRGLMVQALHPLAMAGVDQHSQWREDPVGRLAATSAYLATVIFGDTAAAQRAAGVVRRIHKHVEGVDEVTGRRYAASDPALLLWVHAALVDSELAVRRLFGTQLSPAQADQYVTEMVAAAELVGIPRPMVPADTASLASYLDSVRGELCRTAAAAESAAYLLDPPGLDEDVAAIWQDIRYGALAALPDWARQMYGYELPEPLTEQRKTEVRQALGVLDTVFIGEPGVLEARQRIAARARAARQR